MTDQLGRAPYIHFARGGGGQLLWKNIIDSVLGAESIATYLGGGGVGDIWSPTIENFIDSVCGAESNLPILGRGGRGPMVSTTAAQG